MLVLIFFKSLLIRYFLYNLSNKILIKIPKLCLVCQFFAPPLCIPITLLVSKDKIGEPEEPSSVLQL